MLLQISYYSSCRNLQYDDKSSNRLMLDLLYKIYFAIPSLEPLGKFGKAFNRVQDVYFLKPLLERYVRDSFSSEDALHGLNDEQRDQEIVFSLTSFPARIEEASTSIECLMRQKVKADRIILWLAQSQFKNIPLPTKLLNLQNRGLEIRYVDDLRSHKKYFYALQQYPNALIITFDDDLYYDSEVVGNLLNIHNNFPGCIAASRAHLMTFGKSKLKPYSRWRHNSTMSSPSFELFHTSGAGTLFPPGLLRPETFDKELIMKLSPNSDDVWLKVMSYLSDIKVVTNSRYNKDWATVGKTQSQSLVSLNTNKGGKDEQLRKVMDYFGVSVDNNKLKIAD